MRDGLAHLHGHARKPLEVLPDLGHHRRVPPPAPFGNDFELARVDAGRVLVELRPSGAPGGRNDFRGLVQHLLDDPADAVRFAERSTGRQACIDV